MWKLTPSMLLYRFCLWVFHFTVKQIDYAEYRGVGRIVLLHSASLCSVQAFFFYLRGLSVGAFTLDRAVGSAYANLLLHSQSNRFRGVKNRWEIRFASQCALFRYFFIKVMNPPHRNCHPGCCLWLSLLPNIIESFPEG